MLTSMFFTILSYRHAMARVPEGEIRWCKQFALSCILAKSLSRAWQELSVLGFSIKQQRRKFQFSSRLIQV